MRSTWKVRNGSSGRLNAFVRWIGDGRDHEKYILIRPGDRSGFRYRDGGGLEDRTSLAQDHAEESPGDIHDTTTCPRA